MTANTKFFSPTNAYLPVPTSQVIAYTRQPGDFAMNRYVQYVGHEAPTGLYWSMDRDQPVRQVSLADYEWAPGADAPTGHHNLSRFTTTEFRCERKAVPFTMDIETVELARKHGQVDPIAWESMQTASQLMTLRARRIWALLDTSGNFPSTNVASGSSWGGGKWDVGTSLLPYFQQGILAMVQQINLQTNGVARPEDCILILEPTDAIRIGKSAEMHDYMKGSPFAHPMITGETNPMGPHPNYLWGLPSHVAGVEICVENTPYVSTRMIEDESSTAGTRAYVKAAQTATMVYRPGGINGVPGAKSFSTIQMYYYKYEMAVMTKTDDWNQKIQGLVVDWNAFKIVAGHTGAFASAITH